MIAPEDDIFAAAGVPLPVVLSPRLRWMEANRVRVVELPENFRDRMSDILGTVVTRAGDCLYVPKGAAWAAHQEVHCPLSRILRLEQRWHQVFDETEDMYAGDSIADDIGDCIADLHYGATEDDAVFALASKKKLKLWNEEGGLQG